MSGAQGDLDFGDLTGNRSGASHPNPMFDFLTGFAPRKLKDLFRWVEYLFYNSAHIFAALKKFSEYAITEVQINCTEEKLKENWKKLLDTTIKIKNVSIKSGLDLQLYGNSFISVYKPFTRFLICDSCTSRSGIRKLKYKFKLKTMTFHYRCPSCHNHTTGKIDDDPIADQKRINIIRWDPKLMDINYNPITGESKYYYTIPQELKAKVQKGDAHIINTMPKEFLLAMKQDKVFEFADGQIYHMKIDPPAGIEAQWGFPPLTATIKLFFYAAILRKANEAIALEHITPFRVLHPAPISGTADPASQINMGRWTQELKSNIRKWRRDPLHIMFAPAALGVTMMGGNGRALLTLGEVKEAEDNIIAAMGIPREFLYGGLSFTGSAITLRMLENQLETFTSYQNEQMNWIIEQVANILGWKAVDAEYTPFKLIDDTQQKQLLVQLNLQKPIVSDDTILSMHDIDINEERDKRKQEQLDEARFTMELQREMEQLQNTLAQQAQQEAASGGGAGLAYNPQQVLARADEIAQTLTQMDQGTSRSHMDHLSQEDPVMYAVVKDRMAMMQQMQKQQAGSEQQQAGAA